MDRILVFIDESGTPCPTERAFVAAAVWCLPSGEGGCQQTLRYSIDRMREFIKDRTGKHPHELRFSAGLARYADDLTSLLMTDATLKDRSIIRRDGFPLDNPLRFSTSSTICTAEIIRNSGRIGPVFGNELRARTIPDIMHSAMMYRGRVDLRLDIVFDENIWRTVEKAYGCNLKNLIPNDRISVSVEYRKSSSVPGLQLADLVAGITRNHLLNGENSRSFRMIQDARVFHFSERD